MAKLGCAVEHARLTTHEQRLHSTPPDQRKDFEYRVLGQVNHQGRSKLATTFLIRASALAVKGNTTKPILRRRFLQAWSSGTVYTCGKTQKTPQHEIALAQERLKELLDEKS